MTLPGVRGELSETSSGVALAHGVWAVAVCLAGLTDGLLRNSIGPEHPLFLLCGLAPFAVTTALRAHLASDIARLALYLTWTISAASVVLLAGAHGALLAAWFAGPVIAALAFGPRRSWAEAAALAFIGLASVSALRLSGAVVVGAEGDFALLAWLGAAPLALFATISAAAAARRDARRSALANRRLNEHPNVLESLPYAILQVRSDGRVVSVSGAESGVMHGGVSLVGATAASVFDAADRSVFEKAVEDSRCFQSVETLNLRVGGKVLLTQVAPMRGDGCIVIARDVHGMASVEALAGERDRALSETEAKAQFFASMTHELRTPLNAILGFSDMMRERVFGPMPAKYAEYADHIHEAASHLLDMVGSVLDFSKINAGRYELEIERFDALEVVEATLRMTGDLADAKGLQVAVEAVSVEVEADRRALRQILINLVSNAVKFTPRGGRVDIRSREDSGYLTLEVADTGVGISTEELATLGRPYEQTESGRSSGQAGTGLGLAIVRALVDLHGGRFEAESTQGAGATMRIRLPVLAEASSRDVERLDARARLERVRKVDWSKTQASGEG